MSMELCFVKDLFLWVRDVKRVFVMPLPQRDNQIIFSYVCNFAGYHASVTIGTISNGIGWV